MPVREIALDASANEPPLPVYDPSGPYTDPDATIDVEKGLPRTRIEWVKERGGVEEYVGRPIKPVDNGNVSGQTSGARVSEYAEAAAGDFFSLPPCGGGSAREAAGRGVRTGSAQVSTPPTPNPLPARRGRESNEQP